jgi:alkanesulfonate monooxygenase SsuD/methylene tetrahydromethanopterin reductase-like flavin-dependent oxidoreductase (luciferase family)
LKTNVKFGIRIPTFPVDGSNGEIFRDQIFQYVGELEGLYDSAWVADHFVPWDSNLNQSIDTIEAMTTITYLAAKFPMYKYGSIVLSQSYRSPALLAKMAAILQILSEGRFILGIGAGWKKDEYLAYGYDFPKIATRIYQMKEAIQIIKKMWTEPKATFHGKHYHIEDAICEPKPNPVPPILIGGGGKKITLRIVAEEADWWNFPGGTAENYAELLEVLHSHCQTVGRDYNQIVKTWATECVSVADTHEKALEIAKASHFYNKETSIVGTPEEVATQLKLFTDLGVTHFIIRFPDFPKTEVSKMFSEEVIPLLSFTRA